MKKHIFTYPSVMDLVSHALNDKSEMKLNQRSSRETNQGDDWYGASWETARELAVNGDIDGARRLSPKILENLNAMANAKTRLDPVYKLDEGQWIDVARYVRGEPECWGSMVSGEPAPSRAVALFINYCAPSQLRAHQLDKVGVAVGTVILGLQAQGYAVTVYYGKKLREPWSSDGDTFYLSAPLNPGGAPLDIAHLSTVLRPWFLRRIAFSLYETLPKATRSAFGFVPGGAYGSSTPMTRAEAASLTGSDNVIVVDVGFVVKHSSEQIAKDLLSQIKGDK